MFHYNIPQGIQNLYCLMESTLIIIIIIIVLRLQKSCISTFKKIQAFLQKKKKLNKTADR